MRQIETDYLVVGAGASGMAFVDALIADSEADVVIVDRRHRPGGHWLDGYPFLRLHQPSAYYGVNSRVLGNDRIDESGPNAGFYERATAAEVCDYYTRVLEEHMLASGQVRFFGMCDYRGADSDGHCFVSALTGATTTVKVRRKLVDATYMESSVPSRHIPAFEVDPDVRLVSPNDLVNLGEPASGYTVIGAGKTSMDTCTWLMDQGVAPDDIRWVRPRDAWTMNRALMQPLEFVGSILEFRSRFIEACAQAESAGDIFRRLEAHGIAARVDRDVEPSVFRAAILSATELESLRRIENVVRGRVRRLGSHSIILEDGSIRADPARVYVDCTAAGLKVAPARPIFEPTRVTMQMVTFGVTPWSGATLGYIEATRQDDADKNRLCVPSGYSGEVADMPRSASVSFPAGAAQMAEPDLVAWNEACRLNPARAATDHIEDPRVQSAFARITENIGPAMTNLAQLTAQTASLTIA